MNLSSRPLPAWVKVILGALGLALIGYSGWSLYVVGPALWQLAHSKEGIFARSGQPLLEGAARCGLALILIYVGVRMLLRSAKKEAARAAAWEAGSEAAAVPSSARSRAASKRWHVCNVLHIGPDARRVWQFDAHNGSFSLNRQQTSPPGEPLPRHVVGKSWGTLLQPRLNVAWLPPEEVFVRVAHFPRSSLEETRAMVELQLEKLSPIPVTQAVWSMHVLPQADGTMQTVVVVLAARSVVEEFLGRLEGQGFLADRLELPLLDQLQATAIREDGAWVYPEAHGGPHSALVAWWYGGVLQNVDLLTLPSTANRAAGLKDQLMQMAWAGELEGWMTSSPRWHLVADAEKAGAWEPALREGLEQPIEIVPPLPDAEVAARTARRATQADPQANLLPTEFAARYRQQFVDRLWLRGLGAVLGVYVTGLAVYFVALTVMGYKARDVENQVRQQGPQVTNAMQLTAQVKILKDRKELKFAALDCWEAVAETLPENVTLDTLAFSDGKLLRLSGSAPQSQVADIFDFVGKLRKHPVRDQVFFDPTGGEQVQTHPGPGGVTIWSFGLQLKRGVEK